MEVIDEDKEHFDDTGRFPTVHCWKCGHYYQINYFPTKEPIKYDEQRCPNCKKYNNEDGNVSRKAKMDERAQE